MTRNFVGNEYFNWMYRLMCTEKPYNRLSYRKLLRYLHKREFTYLIDLDGNRAEDGTDLRFRFGFEHGIDGEIISKCLDNRSCSLLEMLVALAIRCEEHIMGDADDIDRSSHWFWSMIKNLGLDYMTDSRFDEYHASKIIDVFLDRKYAENGAGGLFTVNGYGDMRNVEIWYQMCWYLSDFV